MLTMPPLCIQYVEKAALFGRALRRQHGERARLAAAREAELKLASELDDIFASYDFDSAITECGERAPAPGLELERVKRRSASAFKPGSTEP